MEIAIDIKQEANSSECRKINSTFIACRKKIKKKTVEVMVLSAVIFLINMI